MDVREAVKIAVEYTVDMELVISSDSKTQNIPEFLEERRFSVEATNYDSENKVWNIEVGFTRPWDRANRGGLASMTGGAASTGDVRTYKTVQISDDNGIVLGYGG